MCFQVMQAHRQRQVCAETVLPAGWLLPGISITASFPLWSDASSASLLYFSLSLSFPTFFPICFPILLSLLSPSTSVFSLSDLLQIIICLYMTHHILPPYLFLSHVLAFITAHFLFFFLCVRWEVVTICFPHSLYFTIRLLLFLTLCI